MSEDQPTITTSNGTIAGVRADGVRQFRGIPYAASTANSNRFRPPRPVEPWTGVLDATSWGAKAPQAKLSMTSIRRTDPELFYDTFGPDYPQEQSEDCLKLHVWAPDREPASPRPVMVWLHGGGFDHGTSAALRTDGTALADRQDVVLVAVTHRLGALGYAYLGGLDDSLSECVNVGLLDIISALEWISANIALLGGDPSNVTIFGESGGGSKTTTLMAMPRARELFHKAIVQSGPFSVPQSLEQATVASRALLTELGVDLGAPLRAQVEALDAGDIVDAQERLVNGSVIPGWGFAPVLDGAVLPEVPFEAVTTGGGSAMPLMIGTNENEWGSFASKNEEVINLGDAGLSDRVSELVGDNASAIISAYRDAMPNATPSQIWVRIVGHRVLMLSSYDVASKRAAHPEATDCFEYLFAWTSPGYPELGAFHSIEGGFVFDTTQWIPLCAADPEASALAATVSGAWAAFARTGAPSSSGLPAWPASNRDRHQTMVLDSTSHVETNLFSAIRKAWLAAEEKPEGILSDRFSPLPED
jgi:para-nitrobenzyl esterase